MSRFDEYAKALSRRDLLKRAGVVGAGAVVATPLIQSVAAQAYAASVACLDEGRECGGATCKKPQCGAGGRCLTNSDCAGSYCEGGTCTALHGNATPCGTGATQKARDESCASGYCDGNWCYSRPNIANGSSCHGANKAVADDTCRDGVCAGATDTLPQGYCRYPSGHECSPLAPEFCASAVCLNGTCA